MTVPDRASAPTSEKVVSGPADESIKFSEQYADVAQLVEHHLAKVRVASSNLVIRSKKHQASGPLWVAGLRVPVARRYESALYCRIFPAPRTKLAFPGRISIRRPTSRWSCPVGSSSSGLVRLSRLRKSSTSPLTDWCMSGRCMARSPSRGRRAPRYACDGEAGWQNDVAAVSTSSHDSERRDGRPVYELDGTDGFPGRFCGLWGTAQ